MIQLANHELHSIVNLNHQFSKPIRKPQSPRIDCNIARSKALLAAADGLADLKVQITDLWIYSHL